MTRPSIDEIARRLTDALPQGAQAVRDDLEQNFRSILTSGLARLELVTREEFDVQEAVLARTRAKLEALEARLSTLEESGSETAATTVTKKKTSGKKAAKKKSGAKKATKKSAAGKSENRPSGE